MLTRDQSVIYAQTKYIVLRINVNVMQYNVSRTALTAALKK